MDESIIKNDLLNRFTGYSFVETSIDDMTLVEFKDAGLNVVSAAQKLSIVDCYSAIRADVLDARNPLFLSTTTERNALTNVDIGLPIWNITLNREECFDGDTWTSASGATILGSSTYGAMFSNNSNGKSLGGAGVVKGWINAIPGVVDSATIITFLDNATADRLVVGAGGAGDYFISFSASFTNSGGNTTTASIYKNDVEQVSIKDTSEGDSSKHRNLVASGILTLAENDYIDLRFESSESSDVIKTYQCHVNISKE